MKPEVVGFVFVCTDLINGLNKRAKIRKQKVAAASKVYVNCCIFFFFSPTVCVFDLPGSLWFCFLFFPGLCEHFEQISELLEQWCLEVLTTPCKMLFPALWQLNLPAHAPLSNSTSVYFFVCFFLLFLPTRTASGTISVLILGLS